MGDSYSDKYHHYKEEDIMFLSLAQKKQGDIDKEIMFLRDQHERARNFTVEISRCIERYSKGDKISAEIIIENLGYYNMLLRQHIRWEEHVFYPMACEIFTELEKQELLEDFKKAVDKFKSDFVETSKTRVEEMNVLLKKQFGEEYLRRIHNASNI